MTARPALELTLAGGNAYLPGEEIEGAAAWRLRGSEITW